MEKLAAVVLCAAALASSAAFAQDYLQSAKERLDFAHMRIEARPGAKAARSRRISFARGAAAIEAEVVARSAVSMCVRRASP